MKILILFGSKSDEKVYSTLINELEKINIEVEFQVLSAHRNPEKLTKVLKEKDYQLVIAGAGLAAHLPGVCASLTKKPVFGVPVKAAFGGVDAFFSILQMPTDVPVACCYPEKTQEIINFISQLNLIKDSIQNEINIIIPPTLKNEPFIQKYLDKTVSKMKEHDIDMKLTFDSKVKSNTCNIILAKGPVDILNLSECDKQAVLLHVFMLQPEKLQKDISFPQVFFTAQKGGLWFGVNNVANAVIFYNKIIKSLTNSLEVVKQGSVKNILKDNISDNLIFEFSDRYSIFDWGQMPNEINNKGKALGQTTRLLFQELSEHNIKHHLQEDINSPENQVKVTPVNVVSPKLETQEDKKIRWDYSFYQSKPTQTLVPLEVIFRWGLPVGNSFEKRIKNDPEYLKQLGVSELPKTGAFFESPVIEFSTKLEEKDRYLSYREAQEISGMTTVELNQLVSLTKKLALLLKDTFKDIDLTLWDGKIEYAFGESINQDEREFIVVDSLGPDELRLTYKDVLISKEFLRQYYKNSSWYSNVEKCKIEAKEQNRTDWKEMVINECNSLPTDLPSDWLSGASEIYTTVANALCIRKNKNPSFDGPKNPEELHKNLSKFLV